LDLANDDDDTDDDNNHPRPPPPTFAAFTFPAKRWLWRGWARNESDVSMPDRRARRRTTVDEKTFMMDG
jgi:hypothetical protein